MVLLGIFLSAVSVSQNTKLRSEIRKLVENRANLLDSIGRSEWQRFIEKEVIQIHSKLSNELVTETGVHPALSADDVKSYCYEVIEEMGKVRNLRKNGDHG